MKLKNTFKVKLDGSDSSPAIIEFKRPKKNEAIKNAIKEDPTRDFIQEILNDIVHVEGLEDEHGPMTVEDVKNTKDEILRNQIFWANVIARQSLGGKEAAEKKVFVIE